MVRERKGEGWRADAGGRERESRRVGEYRERNSWEKIPIVLPFLMVHQSHMISDTSYGRVKVFLFYGTICLFGEDSKGSSISSQYLFMLLVFSHIYI